MADWKIDIFADDYTISIITGTELLDPDDSNVDVILDLKSGIRYVPVFFTLQNIKSLMGKYKQAGEKGLYYWAKDMIIVEKLTPEVIAETIAYLYETDKLADMFKATPIEDDED